MTILSTAAGDQGRRLDRVLRKALPGVPLSLIHRLLREGKILVDGRPQGGDFRLMAGQEIGVPVRTAERGPAGRGAPTPPGARGPAPPPVRRPAPGPFQGPSGALRIIYENA
ncbi:MAG: hypothetical protein LBL56_06845, partial [Treponema sp.]|nr:hypothetical protein [Treponema sp.]